MKPLVIVFCSEVLMSPEEQRKKIIERYAPNHSKSIFLVEGVDDVEAMSLLLNAFHVQDWERNWVVVSAGNKRRVRELLSLERSWLGLVDRDEWDSVMLARYSLELPNLIILPRFCIENYLIVPDEIWLALPERQRAKIGGDKQLFDNRILSALPSYVRHGVAWKVVTPLWEGLRARGFKESLASFESLATVQNDGDILNILNQWDAYLEPQRIMSDFQTMLTTALQSSVTMQLKDYVHGKLFWERQVNEAMNQFFGQMSAKERRTKILAHIPTLPEDLLPILSRLE
ncbi:hypothetical protein ABIA54_001514 [Pseudomonas sp. EB276 TE3739]|uniref:DUF4435 domain-containing protein n=1 Tax=Pseudomonas TaxID=286 RepID=UPI00209E4BEB|nr:DUF4435 domain-containing protein [Pseudomonas koreensis]MCP1474398.1 hypothetical protein [Pseudomonas koreensis]